MTFGERLKKARKDSGMTQVELAAKVGAYQTKYQNWESDVHEPDVATINKLADALGVSADWLLGRNNKTKPYPTEFDKEIFLLREEAKQYGPEAVRKARAMIRVFYKEKNRNGQSGRK